MRLRLSLPVFLLKNNFMGLLLARIIMDHGNLNGRDDEDPLERVLCASQHAAESCVKSS